MVCTVMTQSNQTKRSMSLEVVFAGAEDYKFEMEKISGDVELERSELTRPL